MLSNPATKYVPFKPFQRDFSERTWPSKTITEPPIWMSTDLRDGNQALIEPMSIDRKLRFFKHLVKIGFKEIEVGFPSASDTDFDFVRHIIENNLIPDDVTIIVLTQARQELISRTVDACAGAKNAMVHLYNACAPSFRKIVFNMSKDEVRDFAVAGTKMVMAEQARYPEINWRYEYSPEIFSTTEPEFAVEVCNAVAEAYGATTDKKIIFNLPATIEATTPNIYADQIEYFCNNINNREACIVSVHPHNDRGTAVAAAELAVMAGADRVEGCLFGSGERTGNVCLVTLAINLYTQGIHPGLDFSDIDSVRRTAEYCNQLPVHPRHPWAGDLVFTAFSGSHQDAIKKSLDYNEQNAETTQGLWDVAYLPIDPAHIGRGYQDVVRINSQSGKGGVAYILQRDFGFHLPRWTQIDFSRVIQQEAESRQTELTSDDVISVFENTYLNQSTLALQDYEIKNTAGSVSFAGSVRMGDDIIEVVGNGNGPLSAFINAISAKLNKNIHVINYAEHALTVESQSPLTQNNSDANAVAYLQLNIEGEIYSGIGTCSSTVSAMLKAALSALAQAQIADTEHH